MPDITRFSYDRLDFGTGKYEAWQIYTQADLTCHDLFEGIVEISVDTHDENGNPLNPAIIQANIEKTRDARSTTKMAQARSAIILRVAPSQLAHCADADPLNVWLDLKALHRPTGFAASMTLRQKLNSMKKSPSQTMADWISAIKSHILVMESSGMSISNDDAIIALISGLPPTYSHVVSTVSELTTEKFTFEHVSSMLILAELGKPGNASSTSTPDPRNVALSTEAEEMRCHFCDKKGHLKRDCFLRKKFLKWHEGQNGHARFVDEEAFGVDDDDVAF